MMGTLQPFSRERAQQKRLVSRRFAPFAQMVALVRLDAKQRNKR